MNGAFQGIDWYSDRQIPRLWIHSCTAELSSLLRIRFPGSHTAAGQVGLRMLSVLPISLPPEVAKGIRVFPVKS